MGYLERYANGEHEQVWAELQAMGPAVRSEPLYGEAREVANETMRRVRRNCERIIERLRSLGYKFGFYPNGTLGEYLPPPLVPPDSASRSDMETLDKAMGPLPISLVAFWEQVGSVNLIGLLASWPKDLDPLFVDPPAAGVSELDEVEFQLEVSDHFEASLAPDVFHKDNVSGGAPYGVKLPDGAMDFLFRNERHELLFVPYLRLAILRYGGFPGLEGRSEGFAPLPLLVEGLEPF